MVATEHGVNGEKPTDVDNGTGWGSTGVIGVDRTRKMSYGFPGYRALGQHSTLPKDDSENAEKIDYYKFVRNCEWQQYQFLNSEWYSYSAYSFPNQPIPVGPTWYPVFNYLSKVVGIGTYYYNGSILTPGLYDVAIKIAPGRGIDQNSTSQYARKKAVLQLVKANFAKDGYTGNYVPNKIYPLSAEVPGYFTNDYYYFGYYYYGYGRRNEYNFMYSGLLEKDDVLGCTLKWIDPPPTSFMEFFYGLSTIRNVRQSAS
jgi:hypothetical protein